ncbi:MAG TPA: hypothetical protein VGA55_09260 [Bacteroidota bacterium]
MGSQQLLLIVLVTFVVGLSIVTGIRLISSFSQSNDRDMILHQMNVVIGEAKAFAKRPNTIGGGDGEFLGFEPSARLTDTDEIRLYLTIGADYILIQGFGTVLGWDGANPVQVVAQYELNPAEWTSVTMVN